MWNKSLTNNSSINVTTLQNDFKELNLIISGLYITLGVAICFFNVVVIFVYLSAKPKFQQKTANMLLCNQAFVDIFQGLVANGVTIARRILIFGPTEYIVMHAIFQFSMTLGLHTAVLLSLERYLMIVKQFFYRSHVTLGRVRFMIYTTWCSALLFIPFRLAHWMRASAEVDWEKYTLYYVAISDAMVCVIIGIVSYCYVSTYRETKRYLTRVYKHRSGQRSRKLTQEDLRKDHINKGLRVTKLFIFMFIAFILSHLPMFVSGLYHISVSSVCYSAIVAQILDLDCFFYFTVSLFNPLVCLFYKDDYKKRVQTLLRRLKIVFWSTKEVKSEDWIEMKSIVQVEWSGCAQQQ